MGFLMAFQWSKPSEDALEDLQDDPRSRRLSTSRNADTITNILETVIRNRRWALRMMSDELNVNKETIHQILHEDVQKRNIRAEFVPSRLTDWQT
jgi:hypothetical protein